MLSGHALWFKILQRVILDVDSGIDDIIAIIVALRARNIQVIGISTVKGNVDAHIGTSNVVRVLEIERRLDIPVFKGSDVSLNIRPLPSRIRKERRANHGVRGLGKIILNDEKMHELWNRITPDEIKRTNHYSDFLEFIIRKYPDEDISIVATGPLTNIANLVKKGGHLLHRIKEISIMGGSYHMATSKLISESLGPAEFNFFFDPEAARIVLNFKNCFTRKLIGLNLTQDSMCSLTKNFVNKIFATSNLPDNMSESLNFLSSLLNFKVKQNSILHLHDVLAVFILEEPSLFRFIKGDVEVLTAEGNERGLSLFRKNIKGNASVASHVNGSKFRYLLQERLRTR
jgi:inosine-uridine nucleoside N-ribohydrolase